LKIGDQPPFQFETFNWFASMRHSLICFLLTGLFVVLLAQSGSANSSVFSSAFASAADLPVVAPSLPVEEEQNEKWAGESDIAPAPVPEPSSSALFGFGILFMLYLIRRRHLAMAS
jgi:hypothetical protein